MWKALRWIIIAMALVLCVLSAFILSAYLLERDEYRFGELGRWRYITESRYVGLAVIETLLSSIVLFVACRYRQRYLQVAMACVLLLTVFIFVVL